MPTCVSGDTNVFTTKGIEKIQDIQPDGKYILEKFNKGEQQTYNLITERGYSLCCTEDHPILTQRGYIKLKDLDVATDLIKLSGEHKYKTKLQMVKYKDYLADITITIDEDLALFLGLFMGDGCFSGFNGTVGITCTAEDINVRDKIKELYTKFFGNFHERIIGPNKGGTDIRFSSKDLIKQFKQLDLLRQNGSCAYKRNVHVLDYIKKSPKHVIKQFLTGLFESDGFVSRDGNRVSFFSKYNYFIKDVQILLLIFGIESKLRTAIKYTNGYDYVGYDLNLKKEDVYIFNKEIGFLSDRKRNRISLNNGKGTRKRLFGFDNIKSIEKHIIQPVFDITTNTHYFNADGIVVHNCPEEAFISAGSKLFDQIQVENLKKYITTPIRQINSWTVFEDPKPNHTYIMAADPSEGVQRDDSAVTILDITPAKPKVVATYKNNYIAPDMFAFELKNYAVAYNYATVMVERNNTGHATITQLKQIYPPEFIYKEESNPISEETKQIDRFGWHTSMITKPKMFYHLSTAINEDQLDIPSEALQSEMHFYDRSELSNTQSNPDASRHFDLLTSLAIALQGIFSVKILTTPVSVTNIHNNPQSYPQQPTQSNQNNFNPFAAI
ncbi:MAG: LAGLIDADG family homing endonuclease [Candidatus Gracilibacteria bacterium]